ncbi:FixH family protein [Peribacillus loiseleuriae]|uniref:FixH family protein n=1 Tax=Peribacillus loiseleuriae TaxID=1679170 RepID=UPI0006711B29|nr:FixH family protein [Peribacillus loiseleuriae]
MIKKIVLGVLISMMLVACQGNAQPEGEEVSSQLIPLTAVIKTEGVMASGTEMQLVVSVMQGSKTVADADDVVFEVRRAGQDERKMLPAEHMAKGDYSSRYTFEEAGTYYIVVHVTANGLHVMPEKVIEIASK